jgi:RNA polymerase sigma-32 factor
MPAGSMRETQKNRATNKITKSRNLEPIRQATAVIGSLDLQFERSRTARKSDWSPGFYQDGPQRKKGTIMSAALRVITADLALGRYLDEIRRFPMLEPQEEYLLAKRWRERGDSVAAHKLVTSHLRLVAKVAIGYRGYGLPIGDVISEGNVGLMQAVKRFEPERGFRLTTYAMWWIKAAIQEYILRSWSVVKIGTSANQKKLFFNLRKAKSRIAALDEGDMHPDHVRLIAKRLGATERDVIDMNRRFSRDASLNAPIGEDGDSGEWQDWLIEDRDSPETTLVASEEMDNRRAALSDALEVLNDRERRIFEARRLADEPVALEDLAIEFGVSKERVRQIEVRAFEKVQKAVKNRVAAMEAPVSRGARALEPGLAA